MPIYRPFQLFIQFIMDIYMYSLVTPCHTYSAGYFMFIYQLLWTYMTFYHWLSINYSIISSKSWIC